MPEDRLSSMGAGISGPLRSAFVITPHATSEIARVTRGIMVGAGGNLACRFADDTADVTLTGLLAGVIYPFRLSHVRSSGTTATSIVGFD